MRSKILAYFADFLLYLLLSGCSIVSVLLSAAPNILYWRSHRLSGISAWTLIEYPVHKYVLQLALLLPARHATHYDAPTGLIKTPTLGEPSPDVGHLRCSRWSSREHKWWSSGRRSCDLLSSAPRRTPCRPWFEALPCAVFDLCGASSYGACTSSLGRSLRSSAGRVLDWPRGRAVMVRRDTTSRFALFRYQERSSNRSVHWLTRAGVCRNYAPAPRLRLVSQLDMYSGGLY